MVKRSTWILVGLALALAVGVYLYEGVGGEQRQKTKEAQSRLLAFQPDAAQQIQIAGLNQIQLERQATGTASPPPEGAGDPAQWTIIKPLRTGADNSTVNTLVSTLAELSSQEVIADPAALKEYGLDPAVQTFTLTLKDGKSQSLKLGSPDFDGKGIYALDLEGTVVTVPFSKQAVLTPDLFKLRDKLLLAVESPQVQSLSLKIAPEKGKRPDPALQLESTASGWILKSPQSLPLDLAVVNQYLAQLSTLQATSFVAEDKTTLKTYGLDTPSLELVIVPKGSGNATPSPLTLILGRSEEGKTYATSSGIAGIATVPDSVATELKLTLEAIRSKQLLTLTLDQLNQVVIQAADPGLSRTLNRVNTAEDWTPSDQPERKIVLNSLVDPLTSARAIEFVSRRDAKVSRALKSPLFSLTLKPTTGEPTTLAFAQVNDKSYVSSSIQEDFLEVNSTLVTELKSAVETLKPLSSPAPSTTP